ncbi:MAG TPA: hypothetical protein VLA19_20955 [Herpetosiphonaceae bacterium]|nr:hypothetical protein [Herpetosiphonaceae bacterium]
MSESRPPEHLEERLVEAAASFGYPPTPDIASSVRERLAAERARRGRRSRMAPQRLAWALAVLVLLSGALAATPDARARILAFLRIGSIEIVVPTVTPALPTVPSLAATEQATTRPAASPTPLSSRLNLNGQTTLDDAQTRVDFPIRLPSYPPNLAAPDGIYVQDLGGPAVILVWLERGSPARVSMSLHQLTEDAFAQKLVQRPEFIQETTVNGRRAAWVRGPHLLQFRAPGGGFEMRERRLVLGNVLIWEENEITYRLETELPLEEAVRVAESLR